MANTDKIQSIFFMTGQMLIRRQ